MRPHAAGCLTLVSLSLCMWLALTMCPLANLTGSDTGIALLQVDFIEKTIATEKRLQTLTYVAAFAVIALVVFAGATFGLTYVVIDMTKEAQPAVSHAYCSVTNGCHLILPDYCTSSWCREWKPSKWRLDACTARSAVCPSMWSPALAAGGVGGPVLLQHPAHCAWRLHGGVPTLRMLMHRPWTRQRLCCCVAANAPPYPSATAS